MEYILDLCCYAYYVKDDNIIDDHAFDALEKLYCKMTGNKEAPMRAIEDESLYSNGVRVIYDIIKKGHKNG